MRGLIVPALLFLVGLAIWAAAYVAFDTAEAEKQVFHEINSLRQRFGIEALKWDDRLYLAAKHHAGWVANRSYLSHYEDTDEFWNPMRRARHYGYFGSAVAENIYYTSYCLYPEQLARDAVDAWMHSLGHRRNMLNPKYLYAAVAVEKTLRGCYVVLVLGS